MYFLVSQWSVSFLLCCITQIDLSQLGGVEFWRFFVKGDALCWLGEKRAGGSETNQAQMTSNDSQSKK